MDRILNKNGKLINNIIYPSMVFTLVYLFGLAIGIGLNIPLQILIILAISIIVKFLLLNPLFLYILLLLIFISSLFISYFFTPYMQLLLDKAYILLVNIINHLKGQENIAPENLMVFWGILIVLVALFTSFIMFKNKKIFMLLPIYIGSFLYYWYIYFDEAYWMISIFIFLFLILMGLDKYHNEKLNSKNKSIYDYEEFYIPWNTAQEGKYR